jgi:putative ABC transport system ATP-binding protein
VFVAGAELSRLSDDDCTRLRREKIGMIFQTFNLLPTLSALNVALPLRLQGQSRRVAEQSARQCCTPRVAGTRGASAREMSGGERQRTAIARALIFRPPLLLADEPTGNLDSLTGEGSCACWTLHRELGMTILIVTHNESAAAHCERQIVLRDGRIVRDYEAKPSQLFPGGAEMLAGFRGSRTNAPRVDFHHFAPVATAPAASVADIARIALGVAVFFAVRTPIHLDCCLRATIEQLGGKATLQVVGGEAGFSPEAKDGPGYLGAGSRACNRNDRPLNAAGSRHAGVGPRHRSDLGLYERAVR